jgi:hypothetical protein
MQLKNNHPLTTTIMKMRIWLLVFGWMALASSHAQAGVTDSRDTLIIEFGNNSRIIFLINSREDLEAIKKYDLNALVQELSLKMEESGEEGKVLTIRDEKGTRYLMDTTIVVENTKKYRYSEDDPFDWSSTELWERDNAREDRSPSYNSKGKGEKFNKRTNNHTLFDFGINGLMEEGKFPDNNGAPYAVRPWGSWYVGINSINNTTITRNFRLEWGVGINWYNFKFENDRTLLTKTPESIEFDQYELDANFRKSKLTATFVQASMVPMVDFGKNQRTHSSFPWGWRSNSEAFRVGLGGYAGYRIHSYTKTVYRENGNRQKDKNKDSYYLNNLRYGLRLQMGYKSTDIFVNYDLNDLFSENRGPKVQAFSFGVIL